MSRFIPKRAGVVLKFPGDFLNYVELAASNPSYV